MEVKFKKLTEEAVVPKYSRQGDAGMDLVAIKMKTVTEGDFGYIEYSTGIAVEIPTGYAGLVFPRSSISNTGMILSNSVGLIDSGYRGDIKLRFKYIAGTKYYEIGDKIGQLTIVKLPIVHLKEVDELGESERGEGSFGHSDDIVY